ncbi:beta strand repeat-containing protein [Flavobacterium sp.]|jgi:hypothetical protein|uniref:beta strand repeat-containing protein n=1 Tax=Flavobacterium sp. TaxID=239 RepID=UPI0037BF88D2
MKKIQLILSLLILSIGFVNAQNVGVGTTTPSHKLHIKGQVRIDTLVSGSATDSIIVADPATGLLKRVSAAKMLLGNTTNTLTAGSNAITNTTNGIAATLTPSTGTLSTKFLGFDASGNLVTDTALTSIPATTNTLASATNIITSTVNGIAATASAVNTVANSFNTSTRALTTTVNGVAGTAVTIPNGIDSTTASNGLTLNGKDVRLGGTLSGATTLTTSSTNTLALAGLQSGSNTDSVLVVNPTTGVLARKSVSTMLPATTNTLTAASNAITNTTNGVAATLTPSAGTLTTKFLGFDASGNLVTDTALTSIPATTHTLSSATNTITSTVNGIAATASAVNTVANSFNTSTRALTTTVNGVAGTAVTIPNGIDSTTASNGLTLNGKDVKLGGTLSSATTITASSTNTLALAGLQSGVATDSIMVLNPTNNVIRMVSLATLLASNNIVASVSGTVPALSIGDAGSITLTVTGAAVGNSVVVNPTIDLPNGVVLAYARVSAANTVKVGFVGTGSSTSFTTNFDVRVIK